MKVATSVNYPPENNIKKIPSCYPIISIKNKLASNRVLLLNFHWWFSNICLLYNNCLTDHFITDQNLAFADMQACFLSFTQTVHWKDIWLLVTEIFVSMFLESQNLFFFFLLEMYWMYAEYMIRQYQLFLSKLVHKAEIQLKEL